MTIVDIAKESGYSVSTVSRVLNNRRDVSPEAKRKIEEIVRAHNFVRNDNARHLKQIVTKNILVLVKGTSNMLFASIIEEIQKLVNETEYTVALFYLDEDNNEVEEAIRLCRERKPMGILFLGGNPQSFIDEFEQVTIPCVLVTNQGNDLDFANLSSVATDDVAAAECAVDYLIEQGHKNIAVLGGDVNVSYTSKQRYLGCQKSFERHELKFDFDQYYEKARFSYDSAYRAMTRMLEKNLPLTGVFAMSDITAIGAIRAIRDKNLRVPEDVSVVGFDGTVLAHYYNPRIATVCQKYEQIASRSVEILFHMISMNKTAIHEVVSFSFSDGESVKKLEG